jgi:hypothetical protein
MQETWEAADMRQSPRHDGDREAKKDSAAVKREVMLASECEAARRLCDLLDTLVAMRWDVGTGAKRQAAEVTLDPEKIATIRLLLDHAIDATKMIIGDTTRPMPPL